MQIIVRQSQYNKCIRSNMNNINQNKVHYNIWGGYCVTYRRLSTIHPFLKCTPTMDTDHIKQYTFMFIIYILFV